MALHPEADDVLQGSSIPEAVRLAHLAQHTEDADVGRHRAVHQFRNNSLTIIDAHHGVGKLHEFAESGTVPHNPPIALNRGIG